MEETNKIWEPIDFAFYIKFVSWQVLTAIVGEVALRFLADYAGAGFLYDGVEWLSWVWRLIILAVLGWRVVSSFGYSELIGAVSGVLAGFGMGLVISLYRLSAGFAVWKIFNVLTETVLAMIVGGSFIILFIYAASFFSKLLTIFNFKKSN